MKNLVYVIVLILSIVTQIGCKERGNEEFRIGVIFPMSAGGGASGQSAFNALQMCANEWNEKGGVLGRKIVFDLQDSEADPKKGLSIATGMVAFNNKPDLIVSAISGVTLNVQSITEKKKVILMGIIGADAFINEKNQYSLRNFITSDITCNAIVNIVKEKYSGKRFNVAYCNTELGKNFSDVMSKIASANGVAISQLFSFEEKETDYKNLISKHSFSEDDIVYVIGVDRPLGVFVRQLRQYGFKGTIIGDINLINSSCVDMIGEYMTNMCYIDVKKKDDSVNNKFKEKYGHDMDVLATYCYNGLDLLMSFITEKGNDDNTFIMDNINGYLYDGKIGQIKVKGDELIYEHELIEIK